MKWFDRAFEFNMPVWMGQNLMERLRGTPARLEERLDGVSEQVLKARPNGEWSIQENVGHLIDLEPLWYGRIGDILGGETVMRPADLENRKTHEADHNARSLDGLLEEFRAERKKLMERLDELSESQLDAASLHPRLEQPMRILDLMFFVAEHDDHHLAQISRLLG